MSEPAELPYVGKELELFAHARNWKRYWGSVVGPYLRGDVLEVGAGLGANTQLLRAEAAAVRRWVCLEPDSRLLEQLQSSLGSPGQIAPSRERSNIEARLGTVESLDVNEQFDAILYIDVLEHIPDDALEIRRAAARLREGGHLIVLSPAHGWLFSAFDKAIGHYRRYTRKSMERTAEGINELRLARGWYLDACGFFASAANRVLLRQAMPTLPQILFWDRVLVPCSRVLDHLLFHRFGKSVLAIWKRGD
jgi:SAM-dependent methyltransferase